MEDQQTTDQPAVVERIAPPPDKITADVVSKPREAFSLAVRPRYRCTGTDRYGYYQPAASEIIKIPVTLKSATPAVGGNEVELMQAYWDRVDWGIPENVGSTTNYISTTVSQLNYRSPDSTLLVNDLTPDLRVDDTLCSVITSPPSPGTLPAGTWAGRLQIARGNHYIQDHFYSFEVQDDTIRFGQIYLRPPIVVREQETLTQFYLGVRVLDAVNTYTFSVTPTAPKEVKEEQPRVLDVHDLLESNSNMFSLFEAYKIRNITLQFTDVSNWLKSTAQCYAAYIDDPERIEPMPVDRINDRAVEYDPRQANLKFFTAGHNCTFDVPLQDGIYFTLKNTDSEKRFVSPGVVQFGVINHPGDVFHYTVTFMAEVSYYMQTVRSTAPAIGRTVTFDLPSEVTAELISRDRFLPVNAGFTWDVPNGKYFALQPREYTVELPDNTGLTSSIPRIDVIDKFARFRVLGVENFDYNFVEGINLKIGFSTNSSNWYYIPE